jgi:hypothetical protein
MNTQRPLEPGQVSTLPASTQPVRETASRPTGHAAPARQARDRDVTTPDEQPGPDRRRVRPYAMTGGRTRPTHDDLEIEALISTTSVGERTPTLTVEQRAIAVLCHDILSIAEVSAQLHLPLGVIRVLVGDMADQRLVMVHRPAQAGDRPDLSLLERVLYGLHTI